MCFATLIGCDWTSTPRYHNFGSNNNRSGSNDHNAISIDIRSGSFVGKLQLSYYPFLKHSNLLKIKIWHWRPSGKEENVANRLLPLNSFYSSNASTAELCDESRIINSFGVQSPRDQLFKGFSRVRWRSGGSADLGKPSNTNSEVFF